MTRYIMDSDIELLINNNGFEKLVNQLTEDIYQNALRKKEIAFVENDLYDYDDPNGQEEKIEKTYYTAIIPSWITFNHDGGVLERSDSKVSLYDEPVINYYTKEIIMDFETHFKQEIKCCINSNLFRNAQFGKLEEMISEIYNY